MKATWRAVEYAGVLGIMLGGLTLLLIPAIQRAEQAFMPIKTDFKIVSAMVDGEDLLISGTAVKHRDCEYLPPTKATDLLTNKLLLIDTMSDTATVSWPPDDKARPFGPWRVLKGAGRPLEFHQEFRCHFGWTSNVYLGRYPEK